MPTSISSKFFQDLCLEKLDNVKLSSSNTQKKRKKVNPYGEIVTSNQQFIKALQENKKEKSKGRNKKPVHESDTDSDSSIPEYDEIRNDSYSEDDTEMLKTHEKYFPPVSKSKEDGYKYLNEMWDTLNPPVKKKIL